MNSVNPAHTPMWKPSSKALMGQVSEKSKPNLPNVGLKYILANYIKPKASTGRDGLFETWKSFVITSSD